MKKILVIILILILGYAGFANVVDLFQSISPPVRTVVGIGVGILGASWAYTWFFDPIVVLVENPFGAVSFGPFILFDRKNWTAPENFVWNHEYSHYCQYAFLGPAMFPLYVACSGFSLVTTGNIWDSNPFERYPMNDISPPSWQPQFILKFGDD